MKNNLYIVESPFQLLSAIEANNFFNDENNILIIRYNASKNSEKNNEQLKLLKNMISWHKIYEIDSKISVRLSNYKLLFFIKKILGLKLNKIFIGDYRSWIMREYFNILNPKQCFLLDDGNISIEIQKKYLQTALYYYSSSNKYKQQIVKIEHKILSKLIDYKYHITRKDINLFTCFEIKPLSHQQIIINHSFDYIKLKNNNKKILANTVYFFGGNYSELNILSEEDEFNALKNVNDYFQNKKFKLIYLPHRKESPNKLEKISTELNIEIRFSKYPSEIEFTIMKEIPFIIASFFSTALYTTTKLTTFHETIAFKFPYDYINHRYLNDIMTIYNEYEKTFKIVDIK